jgi:2-keto-myo-inositol isomerase
LYHVLIILKRISFIITGKILIDLSRFALNRIASPRLGLEEFFRLTADLGLSKVELRNDLPGGRVTDGLPPEQVVDLCGKHGIQIITINALQRFNVASMRAELLDELRGLLETAQHVRCPALVLCPNNDTSDSRSEERIRTETVAAFSAFAPVFEDSGVTGLVEPLGFEESSLDSLVTTMEMIEESGYAKYRIVHDTFHHKLGPDTEETLARTYNINYTGLVHVSGVETELPAEQYRDVHRELVGPGDKLDSRGQVRFLLRLGYSGDISFEPFSEVVQNLPRNELQLKLTASVHYLRE